MLPFSNFKGFTKLVHCTDLFNVHFATCVCARLSACFRKQGRVLFGWKSKLFHMEPGQSRICILCSCLAPWHWLGKGKEPETACRAGQKGVGGDRLASPGMRCGYCASSPPLTYFYSKDEESLKGQWFSHEVDWIKDSLSGGEPGLLKSSFLLHYLFFQ